MFEVVGATENIRDWQPVVCAPVTVILRQGRSEHNRYGRTLPRGKKKPPSMLQNRTAVSLKSRQQPARTSSMREKATRSSGLLSSRGIIAMATAAATAPREALKQGRPHTIRYLNALNTHWRHEITPEDDETAKIGHQAVNYLTALLLWADQNFLMPPLHRGQPLGLANDALEEITGYSQRQCRRLRRCSCRCKEHLHILL